MKFSASALATHGASPLVQPPRHAGGGDISHPGPIRISSQTLFSGTHEIEIEHKGSIYRLRQTSLGKLILTK